MNSEQLLMEEISEEHICTHTNTALRSDAFILSEEEKIKKISHHFREIMHTLGLDLTDDSLSGTPHRVAKMYVQEVFGGLNPARKPKTTLFDNHYKYGEMLIEKNISLYSYCEHHFVPIIGKAHVAYISNGQVIGLSKINRLVQYYASRPQVQERLTIQIAEGLKEALHTDDVSVIIEASHLCVASRGIKDTNSTTITAHYAGRFLEESLKNELLSLINIS